MIKRGDRAYFSIPITTAQPTRPCHFSLLSMIRLGSSRTTPTEEPVVVPSRSEPILRNRDGVIVYKADPRNSGQRRLVQSHPQELKTTLLDIDHTEGMG